MGLAPEILLVEDTRHNMDLMLYLLRAGGYSAREATIGAAALEAIAQQAPDLVILDIHLPDLDGFEVLHRVRSGPAARATVVAVTALSMVGDRDRLLGAGFDGYISKPLEPRTFVSEMEVHLARRQHPTPRSVPTDAGER